MADCEASIEETEAAISIVEAQMATPEGASDMQLYERHQKLKQQLDAIVEEWERVSLELEDSENGILAASNGNIPVVCIPDLKVPSEETAKKTAAIVSTAADVISLFR